MDRVFAWLFALLALACSISVATADELDPKIQTLVPGVSLSLVAEHPSVMTPTGIDVDRDGNIWFVNCHTHFRPENYDGPTHDQVIKLSPTGERRVFYSATEATMDLELSEQFAVDGWVYLTERDRVLRVRDSDGDGVGDTEEDVAVLHTEGTYPHNGLSGMAWHPSGDLVFALGENFWKEWLLSSRDGGTVRGTGEGGIFRCKPDGRELRRIAKGFWNPFGICVRRDGTMFASENDPGARPPCRLIHVVDGGDYGYQRLYGNAPRHPFVCWNGELPGTLPMLFNVGEAPCGIAPMNNGLLVTSWTDNRIDFYPLTTKGASFETDRIELVTGSVDFRPTCIVRQSPTVFYLTDWVFGSYAIHQKGRIWRLEIDPKADPRFGPSEIPAASAEAALAERLRAGAKGVSTAKLFRYASGDDAFVRRAAIDALGTRVGEFDTASVGALGMADQISLMQAVRKVMPKSESWAAMFLSHDNTSIRFEALRWIADEQLKSFLPQLDSILNEPKLDYRLFEAVLATRNTLSGNARNGVADQERLVKQALSKDASSQTRAFALRLIDPKNKKLQKQWRSLLGSSSTDVVREYLPFLGSSDDAKATGALLEFVSQSLDQPSLCADAVAQLGVDDETVGLLEDLDRQSVPRAVREEVFRTLRFAQWTADQRKRLEEYKTKFPESIDLIDAALNPESIKRGRPSPQDITAWRKRLAAVPQSVDIDAGRRIFHHRSVGTCSKCHRHDGRGQVVGPDLSEASSEGNPDRLLIALLQPSRDVDPQYFPRTLVFDDGTSFTGILLRNGGSGREFYRDSTGRERRLETSDIVARKEVRTSLMPEGLIDTMTDREIRDLLAFLDSKR